MTRNTTSAQAARAVGSQFDLVLIASARLRELKHGKHDADRVLRVKPVGSDLSNVLAEVEQGKTGKEYLTKKLDLVNDIPNNRRR